MKEHLMSTYARLPVAFVRGEGVWLWDEQNRRHLDALSGIAVCGLGHAHPALAAALSDQVATLLHTSNLYRIPLQETLGARLCELSGMERVFFCNSGAEANEAAIKLARRLGHARGIDLPRIVVMEGAFHGRTLATLTSKASSAFPSVIWTPWSDWRFRRAASSRCCWNRSRVKVASASPRPSICRVCADSATGRAG